MLRVDTHLVRRSLSGRDADCGDTGLIQSWSSHCLLALVDALGHGREAAVVAQQALQYLKSQATLPPGEMISGLHGALKGSRGAVASVCQLDLETASLIYAGIGNVAARIWGSQNFTFVNRDGVIGYNMPRPQEILMTLHPGDVYTMYSDGVRSTFPSGDLDYALRDSADFIAAEIMSRYDKKDDDASCLVARLLR